MSQWAEIRHLHMVHGVGKKAIARRLGVDVKTVRRALVASTPPGRRRSPSRGRMLDQHKEKILKWLEDDDLLSAKRIRRLLIEDGAKGVPAARATRQFVAGLRRELKEREAYVHRTHRPGDVMEGDFGESAAVIDGVKQKVFFFVLASPASNAYFAKAYAVQRGECLLDGLASGFEFMGGLPKTLVLDNMSMAVKKIERGRDRVLTELFEGFRGSYGLAASFCAPGKGNEKGSVETGVKYVRANCFRPIPHAASFEELNAKLLEVLRSDMEHRRLQDGRSVAKAWQAEREHLRPLPVHRPLTCRMESRRANKFGHVRVKRVTYSVPIEHAYRNVWVRLFHDRVEIMRDGDLIASHRRSFKEGAYVLCWRHILPLLEHKSRAVLDATALEQGLPAVFMRIRAGLVEATRGGAREWVQILQLAEEHPLENLVAAAEEAERRGTVRLESIRQILRLHTQGEAATWCVAPMREDLAQITVSAPDLGGYDDLGGSDGSEVDDL